MDTEPTPTPTGVDVPTPTPTDDDDYDDDRCDGLGSRQRVNFPPSIPNPMNCAGGSPSSSNYAVPDAALPAGATEELHVIGVYEGAPPDGQPRGFREHPEGAVEITVHPRSKPVILFLSSYEPVRWRITVEPGAALARVFTQGYYTQAVEGLPEDVPIIQRERGEVCAYAYGWEVRHNSGGGSYAAMIADIREQTGLTETSFQGCYAGDRFEIPYWQGEPPTERPTPIPGDESIPLKDVSFPGCEAVTAESRYCLTASSGGIAVLGLDSGALCPVTETSAQLTGPFTTSLVWRGDLAYTCAEDGLIRISLRDGAWEALQIPCMAVADYRGGFLLANSPADPFDLGALYWYPSYDALLAGTPGRVVHVDPFFSRTAVQGNTFYGAWHATDTIIVVDLPSEQQLGILTIEGEDDWVQGMAVTEDGTLVLVRSIGGDAVVLYDLHTGEKLRELRPGASLAGLACVVRDPLPTPVGPPTVAPSMPTPTPNPRPTWLPSCEDLARSANGPGQRANHPPSIPIEGNCGSGGYQSSNYATPPDALDPDAAEELHVIGVGEGAANPGFRTERQGVVKVNVGPRPKPVVLVLSAYGSTVWQVALEEGAQLSRVITQGYSEQLVEGIPDDVPVVHRGPQDFCATAYGWELWQGGDGYALMIADVRAFTGLIETSFQGCYTGVEFEVPYWTSEPPVVTPTPVPLDETIPREEVEFPGCGEVTAERQYCLATTYGGAAVVGLDTGEVCPIAPLTSFEWFEDVNSIAWLGEAMYVCDYEAGLIRVSLRDGSWEAAQVPCEAVTDYRGGLLMLSGDDWETPLRWYPDYGAVLRGEPGAAYSVGEDAEVMTVHGDTLYGAWHATDTIEVADLATETPIPPIILEGYDGWVLGMAVTDDGQLVISGDTWGDTIRIFDTATGARIRDLHPTSPVFGLSCVTRR